ncbi:MAG: hypothetical protein FWD33_01265 [Alphaproteobacteria bacterium]|nr:hypothetical protein [Alphaproteobacteria bacterium]
MTNNKKNFSDATKAVAKVATLRRGKELLKNAKHKKADAVPQYENRGPGMARARAGIKTLNVTAAFEAASKGQMDDIVNFVVDGKQQAA